MSDTARRDLVHDFLTGAMTRRRFAARALALGMSASAIGSFLAAGQGDARVGAQEPTPTPYPPETFGGEGAKVKIRYWTILGSVDGIIMNDLVRAFSEENPEIAVESLQGLTDFIPKMQSASISGTVPDVALVRHTYVAPFVSRNMLSALQPAELEQAGIRAEDYDPTVWQFTQIEGQQYTIPLDIHCHAMLHNTKILGDAGVAVPTTLDEWSAAVAATSTDDVVGYQTFALGEGAQEFLAWYWYGILRQFGGEMLSEDATKAAFNTPEGIEAVRWMQGIQQAGNPQSSPTTDLARTGRVATWADGPWVSTLFFDPTKAPAAADLDVAVLPQRDPTNRFVWGQSHQFAVPRQNDEDSAKREAVFTFVDWMTKHSVDWAKAGQVPANNAAREEALNGTDVSLQKLRVWAEQLPYVAYMRSVPALLEVLPRISANVEGAILGQWSVEEGLTKAESEVNRILGG